MSDDYSATWESSPEDPQGVLGLPQGEVPLELAADMVEKWARGLGNVPAVRLAAMREQVIRELKTRGVKSPARIVDAALGQPKEGNPCQGATIDLDEPEPCEEAVDGAGLLDEIIQLFNRFLVLPAGAAELLALWTMHTYVWEAFEHTPYLCIVSPTPRCGKTTTVRIVKELALRALSAEDVSPSAVFRVIEKSAPTLLLDEADRIALDSELWGLLNSGHSRGGVVLRTVGQEFEPRAFRTFCPKVVSYIRKSRPNVPPTVEDRSVRIMLQRKDRAMSREKLRSRSLVARAKPMRSQLARWAQDSIQTLSDAAPEIPEDLDDRAADSWEPLLAIADAVGGRWPERTRALARRFSADRAEDEAEDNPGILLLADLAGLLESGELCADDSGGIAGDTACRALWGLADRPWRDWGRKGDGLSEKALARLLKPFQVQTEMKGPKRRRRRRYSEEAIRGAAARYASDTVPASGVCISEDARTIRTPAHRPSLPYLSDSAQEGVRVCDSAPLTGQAESARAPQTAAPRTEPTVFIWKGRRYREGDRLPDGRQVLEVVDGCPILLKASVRGQEAEA